MGQRRPPENEVRCVKLGSKTGDSVNKSTSSRLNEDDKQKVDRMQSKRPKVEHEKNIGQLSEGLGAIDCLSDLVGSQRCVDSAERAMLLLKKAIELGKKKVIVAQVGVLIENAVGLKNVRIDFYTAGCLGPGLTVSATCEFEVIGTGKGKLKESKKREVELEAKLEELLMKVSLETLRKTFLGVPTSGIVFVKKLCKTLLGPKGAAKWGSEVEAHQIEKAVPIPNVKRRSLSL